MKKIMHIYQGQIIMIAFLSFFGRLYNKRFSCTCSSISETRTIFCIIRVKMLRYVLRTVIPIAKILIVVMFARHLAYLRKTLQA